MEHQVNLEEIDNFLNNLGNPGKYQIICLILCFLNYMTMPFGHMAIALYGWTPKHYCKLPNQNSTLYLNNVSTYLNSTITITSHKCHIIINNSFDINQESHSCESIEGWYYEIESRDKSVVMEWDLVCKQKYLLSLFTSTYFIGVFFGGFIMGSLGDKIGRKAILIISFTGLIIFTVGAGIAQTLVAFIVLRMFQGVFMQGMQSGTYIITSESLSPKWRVKLTPLLHIAWGVGMAFMALIGYLIRNWRYIQIALGTIHVLNLLTFIFIQESLRWLIASGKQARALQVYKKICKINKLEYSKNEFLKCFKVTEKSEKHNAYKYTFLDVVKTPVLRKRSIILIYIWATSTTVYYGISLKVTSLFDNMYINFFFTAIFEAIVYVIMMLIIKCCPRKKLFLCLYIPTAALCLAVGLIPEKTANGTDITKLILTCAVLGRMFITSVFTVNNMIVSELYPTIIRTFAFGMCHASARIGSMLAPQLLLLGSYTFESLPTLLFAAVATGACILILFLPETLNKPLPDTVEDIENDFKTKKLERYKPRFMYRYLKPSSIMYEVS